MTREEKTKLKESVSGVFEREIAKIEKEEAENQKSVDRRNKIGLTFIGLIVLAIFWYSDSVPKGGRNSDAYHEAMISSNPEITLPEPFRMPAPVRDAMSEFFRDEMENGKAPLGCPASTFARLSRVPL